MLLISCLSPLTNSGERDTTTEVLKPGLKLHISREAPFKNEKKNKKRLRQDRSFCFRAEREKRPPAERGDLGTFNEGNGSQAVFLQSAPLVPRHDSQRDTKYIKV